MNKILEKKLSLLNELYDASYILKQAIEVQHYDRIEQMIQEREAIIKQIDALKLDEVDKNVHSELMDQIREILLKIQKIDEFNLKNMPQVLLTLQELINEGKRKTKEVGKAKMVYEKYQGVPMHIQGNRFDIRK